MLREPIILGSLLVLQLVAALPQVHYSGSAISSFRSQRDQPSISSDAVTAALASLLSVQSPVSVDADVSRQVHGVLAAAYFAQQGF